VRQGIWSVDRDVPVSNITTLARNLSEDRWPQRINLAQLLIFCAISLCLAAAGVYGLMSYVVNRRVPEFGLRMALGARPMDVFGLAARQALGLIAAGTVLGLIGAVAFTRLLGTLLVNVSVTDPLIFAVAPGVMAIVAGLASLLPTRRASQVDPVITLREE
jgi:ABC-type antimicrobial peptide transport system permease subunit